jgi:hypothetical protein
LARKLEIRKTPIDEFAKAAAACPVPSAEPYFEATVAAVEFQIMTVSIFEPPRPVQYPVPTPDPDSDKAFTLELEIARNPIDELAFSPTARPVPMPEPSLESVVTTVEFQIVALSIRDAER